MAGGTRLAKYTPSKRISGNWLPGALLFAPRHTPTTKMQLIASVFLRSIAQTSRREINV
jgi:hypothetical protein